MNVIQKAVQLVENGHVDEAIDILTKTAKTCTDDDQVIIAQLYMEWGFFDKAIDLLEQLLKKYKDNYELKVMLASLYIELEQDEQALKLLNMIDKNDPVYSQALLQQADLYESQGLYEVAEQKLLEAKELNPEEMIIDFALGELMFSIGEYHRAVIFYERVLQKEEKVIDVNIKERLAECLGTLGQYEQALTYYESLNSDNPDTLFKHGLIAYHAKKGYSAIKIWHKLLEYDPYYHTVYVYLGRVLYEEGQFNEAFKIVEKGLKVDEYNKELYLLASKITFAIHDINKSEIYARKAIKLDADYKEAILFLIDLFKNNDEYEKIVVLIKEIQDANVYDPDYEWELARAYYELESYRESFNLYNNVYGELQNNSVFLREYGYFLNEEGLYKKAISVFTKYISLVPDDEEVLLFLDRLQTHDE